MPHASQFITPVPKSPFDEIGTDELNRITSEVVLGEKPAIPDTAATAQIRRQIEREVADAKRSGREVSMICD